ncbi:MAG TPA: phytanoyl-CoA dioxygenase family protein [Caldilineaceae bacterium]|nr:phytanoyl-CoA dioxygenase family protein [Caldilineaceae bacterium]
MATAIQHDLELMQYLLDLQGYLIIENALSADEVATLNRLIDEQQLPPPGKTQRFGSAPEGAGFLDWGQPFVDLLDHPTLMPILRLQLGDSFRLDRLYGMYMNEGMGRGALHADYGALARNEQTQPGQYYSFRRNQIYDGFVVVTWNLADAGPDYGGFCCIPGSHKSHYKLPQSIADNPETCPAVIIPEAPAGSITLFTEALTHGTAAWRGKHERRALLYKYCVSHIAWTAKRVAHPTTSPLTIRQQTLLQDPGDPLLHFPSLFAEAA